MSEAAAFGRLVDVPPRTAWVHGAHGFTRAVDNDAPRSIAAAVDWLVTETARYEAAAARYLQLEDA